MFIYIIIALQIAVSATLFGLSEISEVLPYYVEQRNTQFAYFRSTKPNPDKWLHTHNAQRPAKSSSSSSIFNLSTNL